MHFGITLPNLGIDGGVRALAELAAEAEAAGWDGVFVWDSVSSPDWNDAFADAPLLRAEWDPWVVLGVMASVTSRVRLGTMVTPLSRRRPWKVAMETATIDHLSGGRLILPVSLGWLPDGAFSKVGEVRERRERAERLDEALEIVTALWTGEPVTFAGRHFQVDGLQLAPALQQPRPPVWVVAAWPRAKSIERARRWDGILPSLLAADGTTWGAAPTASEVAAIAETVADGFDIVVEGNSSRDTAKARAKVRPLADAGATWWLEGVWSFVGDREHGLSRIRSRIAAGPPPVA
jgi:alkanesulfonate monooxygenase SsuD/methylene tetrahydromethanopterin reductase-like flavin-dependent oxidoreductase (luciferase family)